MVRKFKELNTYLYSGHSTLMGGLKKSWQETEEILKLFGNRPTSSRRTYRLFVEQGIGQGKRYDLAGGDLIRSAGGWAGLKQKREEGCYQQSDERILEDSDFVNEVLAKTEETLSRKQTLRAQGIDLDKIAKHKHLKTRTEDVWTEGKHPYTVSSYPS